MAEPDWLRLQKKIFGRYVQQKLRGGGIKHEIKDLISEVQDGVLLIDLIEVLSGKPYPDKKKPAPNPKAKIQKIDNCSKALSFAKSVGIKSQTSPEDLVEGNEKLVLGLVFQIIIKYMKFEDEEENPSGDVKEALMLWLKNRTAGYNNCNIDNFTKSFHNGLPFCALIHKMRPKLLDYSKLSPADAIGNLTLALDIGAKYCNVEKYLEPTDIAKLDEVSMIVYLSDWYYGVALLQKQDIAAKRIGKLVIMTELHDNMRAQYKEGANQLISWANKKIAEFPNHGFDNTYEGVKKKIEEFNQYKEKEKSQKIAQLMDLENLFDNLALRLANNKRPEWKPEGITPDSLNAKFEELEKAELEKSKALYAELARQIEIINDGLCKSFADSVKEFTDWLNKKKAALKAKNVELEQQLENLKKSVSDHGKADEFLKVLAEKAKKIADRSITNNKFTNVTKEDCEALWTQYKIMLEKKKELLEGQIEEKKKSGLTDEQIQEIKDNFTYFDKDKTGFLERKELRACLQSLGEDASPKDVDAVLAAYDKDGDGKVDLQEFRQFMSTKLGDADTKEEIIQSFKYLAYDKDSIKVEYLENVINDISWKRRHVDYLKREMKPKSDGLDYLTWSDEVFAR